MQVKYTKITYYIYILLCENGAYYTGYTTNLTRRYQEHLKGTAKCKYTRSFKPVCMMQHWQFADKSTALKVEQLIKKMTKQQKQEIILFPEKVTTMLIS